MLSREGASILGGGSGFWGMLSWHRMARKLGEFSAWGSGAKPSGQGRAGLLTPARAACSSIQPLPGCRLAPARTPWPAQACSHPLQ